MPRIVTMIASATEIVCALGFEKELVARSHECDYPPGVEGLPVCTAPKFAVQGSSAEIDQRVKDLLRDVTSVYRVDADLLCQLQPEVIVTQAQCAVCAVSADDVEGVLSSWPGRRPRIVALSPNNLAEVWQSIQQVADALGVPERGRHRIAALQARMDAIAGQTAGLKSRPRVACLEWLDPLMAAGNWVPELVERAGGHPLFGCAGKHSPWLNWEELVARDPDHLLALPCGFDRAKTRAELGALRKRAEWKNLRAVQKGEVYALDGNQFFNRPGPRLVESLEILAEILHPAIFSFGHEGTGWERVESAPS